MEYLCSGNPYLVGDAVSAAGLLQRQDRLVLVALGPGCDITDAPCDVVLSLMNNLAYANGMKPVYEFSFYAGTFGPYDDHSIRRKLAGTALSE
jgi:hypothetical protein